MSKVFTLTVFLRPNATGLLLGFNGRDNMTRQLDELDAAEDSAKIKIADDFGRTLEIPKADIMGTVISDINEENKMAGEIQFSKFKAEQELNTRVQRDPTVLLRGAPLNLGRQ